MEVDWGVFGLSPSGGKPDTNVTAFLFRVTTCNARAKKNSRDLALWPENGNFAPDCN